MEKKAKVEKEEVKVRLAKIEGQIRGIGRMYQERRNCEEILQQVVAVRNALAMVGRDVLADEAQQCNWSNQKLREMIKKLFSLT